MYSHGSIIFRYDTLQKFSFNVTVRLDALKNNESMCFYSCIDYHTSVNLCGNSFTCEYHTGRLN